MDLQKYSHQIGLIIYIANDFMPGNESQMGDAIGPISMCYRADSRAPPVLAKCQADLRPTLS